MAQPSEGAGGFNFDVVPEEIYDTRAIADVAIWPLADYLWRGDWRNDSEPGHFFRFPRSGMVDGAHFEVVLIARCEFYLAKSDEVITDDVTLIVEEIAQGAEKAFIISEAQKDDPTASKAWDEGQHLIVKKSYNYCFGDAFENTITPLIEDTNGAELWVPSELAAADTKRGDEDEDDQAEASVLRLPDLETIELAFDILKAPKAIRRALRELKSAPRTD